jgi:hypothetical protein
MLVWPGLIGLVLSGGGCGTQGFAPDALVPNRGVDAFLDRIGKACGDLNLGSGTVAYRLQNQDDVYFVDESSKLWSGDVTLAQYADDISSFYPGGDTVKVVACVERQLAEP